MTTLVRGITLTRAILVPPSQVWAAFATEEGWCAWCCETAVVDARVGGRYHIYTQGYNARGMFTQLVLERSLAFYRDVIGLELTQRFGTQAAFLSAGGYHHHIGLNTWESAHGRPPAPGTTGLYHAALLYPSRGALGRALQRVLAAGVELEGAADHGVSEALYLRDPDANGIELYWDLPRDCWPRDRDGGLAMFTRPLDLGALLEAAEAGGTC